MRSSSLVVCEVDVSLQEKLKKFRFRKETSNAAILMKIDMEKQLVVLEEEYENISLDELREELPERQCTYIVYSYKLTHGDGRVSYPLCFIFSSPVGERRSADLRSPLAQTYPKTHTHTRSVTHTEPEWAEPSV
uniref:ADF-H domain-containing protein n=1 Tax=Sinocyclocheilus grahami TaxID=75366 RepID=A0A672JWU6_SINGR